jgi:hypothetical protein
VIDVEPIVGAELDRLLPLPNVPLDWAGVERRSGRTPSVGKRYLAAVAVLAITLPIAAVLGVSRGGNGMPSLVDRAYAAISGRSGVMHFVVTYGGTAPTPRYYEEYWFDLAHPSHGRIVQSSDGKVDHQLVYVGGYRTVFGQSGKNHNPITIVTHAPPPMPGAVPMLQGANPIISYRQTLRSGRLVSQEKVTFHGKPAYKLVVVQEPEAPTSLTWSARITYIVDRYSFFPLQYAVANRGYGEFLGLSVVHFLHFEILPATPQSKTLLKAAANPEPYKP